MLSPFRPSGISVESCRLVASLLAWLPKSMDGESRGISLYDDIDVCKIKIYQDHKNHKSHQVRIHRKIV